MAPSFFKEKLDDLAQKGLYRTLRTTTSDQDATLTVNGRELINFSSNNYLGIANHPALKEASIKAIGRYGAGSGASRLITGSMTLHDELESAIATFKGTEAALVFNSGYLANTGVISCLVGEGDFIFSDELNHASIIDGCRLNKAKVMVYRHNDLSHLEELLKNHSRSTIHHPRFLIATDTVFSMDGDLCPLPDIMKLAEKYDALVYVDEAHGTGVFGKNGRGVVEHYGISSAHPLLIQMGTLGKALGSFGAYVCGSRDLINYLINKARTFIFSTSLPPSVLAASQAAINLLQSDASMTQKLWENVRYFKKEAVSPIIPVLVGDAQKTMELSQKLFEKGIWAQGIRPPTVAEGSSRIRFTVMATHTKEQLDLCLKALKDLGL
ncbi:8-amino-7-oxononanoate synthase [bacterium]|nr:8-amino-7-oxononanoate synthase [bacterium]